MRPQGEPGISVGQQPLRDRAASLTRTHAPVRVLVAGLTLLALIVVPVSGPLAQSFESALRKDNPRDLTDWGRRFEHGEGVERDIDRAVRLYCKASAKGDASAQYQLGWIYAMGRAGARNDELAAAWLERAAENSDPYARRLLKRLKLDGLSRGEPACLLSNGALATGAGAVVGAAPGSAGGPAGDAIGASGAWPASVLGEYPARARIARIVRRLAPEYRLNPNLVLAVIETESAFDAGARSPKNAQGLMQLIPATAERFGVRDVWDPEQNIRGGMAYLNWLMGHFDADLELVLAAYNAGEGAVARHDGIPPYAETRNYVRRIIGRLR
jgi:hypothetical protein